ncbi:MAG: hypothetical protein Q7J69_02270 [Candidatus Omnitrophota bacterium]|nr:hypothetical protein [Candidatus Omnitrophota bacterium]
MSMRAGQKGVAMVTAIVLALIVSVLVAGVLSLTMRRFELSAFRTDHTVAAGTSEAGLQYAFARLAADDAVFGAAVRAKRNALGNGPIADGTAAAEYVVTSDASVPANQRDELEPALQMGGKVDTTVDSPTFGQYVGRKNVTLRIRFFNTALNDVPPIANRPYKVRSVSNFGTGGS